MSWNSPGKNTEVGCHLSPGDLPDPGIEPRSLTLQADLLPSEPPGKPVIPEGVAKSDYSSFQGPTELFHL